MDTSRNIAEEALEFRRWGEVVSLRRFAVSILVSLPCLFAGFLCLCVRGAGGMKPRLQLGDPRFPFVQFGVECSHLAQVAALKRRKLTPKIDKLQLTLRESRTDSSQLFAFAEKFLFFGFQPPRDRT
jgi:hypothetical protein